MNTDHQNISYEFDRPHKAWVYSYGLSLAKGFTFAMTLVRSQLVHLTHFCQIGLRVRDWKRVIEQGTNNSLNMVDDVLWLEKKLKLRKAEER